MSYLSFAKSGGFAESSNTLKGRGTFSTREHQLLQKSIASRNVLIKTIEKAHNINKRLKLENAFVNRVC